MSTLCLALAVAMGVGSAPPPISGVVVDAGGSPIRGAELFLSLGPLPDGSTPALATATADDEGRFRIERPGRERLALASDLWGVVWAYAPGKAVSGASWTQLVDDPKPLRIVLEEPTRRTVRLTNPDGSPAAGVRVAPASLYRQGLIALTWLPEELVARLEVQTAADGTAEISGIATSTRVFALRARTGGISLIHGIDQERLGKEEAFNIRLGEPARLAGTVEVEGEPSAGREVEVWAHPEGNLTPVRVRFEASPLLAGADGTYATPPGLRRGMTCRVVVRSRGGSTAISPWVKLDGASTEAPRLRLARLTEVAGRIVDTAGRPIPGVRVTQAGDGPARTEAATDADGRFRLGGYSRPRGVVVARGSGYRTGGAIVEPGAGAAVEVILRRTDEAPGPTMPTLGDPLPREEMVAIARRLLDPYLERALKEGSDSDKFWALDALAACDPGEALERAERARFERPDALGTIKGRVALGLVEADPEEAAALVESIPEPGQRAGYLVDLADALPDGRRDAKLELLNRASLQARAAAQVDDTLFQLAEVAERLAELGVAEKARPLFAEVKAIDAALADRQSGTRAYVAGRLARVDPDAALAIAEELRDPRFKEVALANAALRLAAIDPAASDRFLGKIEDPLAQAGTIHAVCRALGGSDPARAARLAESIPDPTNRAHAWIFLAAGAAETDRVASREAFARFEADLDRIESEGRPLWINPAAAALPLVEAIDPALVPQVLWRSLALREPDAEPRNASGLGRSRSDLPMMLARYDRAVAAVTFAPALAAARQALPLGDAHSYTYAITAALIDPRQAAELIETMPEPAKVFVNEPANWSRVRVAEHLAWPSARAWKSLWRTHTGIGLTIHDRDVN